MRDRIAGMRNRSERNDHSESGCGPSDEALEAPRPVYPRRSKRHSGEQGSTLHDRLTLREAFCLSRTSFRGARLNPSGRPTWEFVRGAKLNPTPNIPDSETEPPGFSGGKRWKSLTVQPVSPDHEPEWNALSVPPPKVFTLDQENFHKNSVGPLSPADRRLTSPAGRCWNWAAAGLVPVVKPTYDDDNSRRSKGENHPQAPCPRCHTRRPDSLGQVVHAEPKAVPG